MLRTRYPYAAVGRLAGTFFAIAGIVMGILVGSRTDGASAMVGDAIVYAVVAGVIAILVFSSEGPRRPESVAQAVSADGVVAGIFIGFFFALVQVVVASGNSSPPSTGQNILALVLSAIAGGAIGGILGLGLFYLAGKDRLVRVRVSRSTRRKRAGSSGRKRRR